MSVRRIAGVGLIEVLVTLLVLSIGMLGIAALQANMLRRSHEGLWRTQAAISIYAALDILRTRRDAAVNFQLSKSCEPPSDLQIPELKQWFDVLHQNLGEGSCAEISCRRIGTGLLQQDICRVRVYWKEKGEEGNLQERSFEMGTAL